VFRTGQKEKKKRVMAVTPLFFMPLLLVRFQLFFGLKGLTAAFVSFLLWLTHTSIASTSSYYVLIRHIKFDFSMKRRSRFKVKKHWLNSHLKSLTTTHEEEDAKGRVTSSHIKFSYIVTYKNRGTF